MQGAQLGPGDLRVEVATQAAVGAGDDVFLADDFSERNEAIGYHFRMLDEFDGMADDA